MNEVVQVSSTEEYFVEDRDQVYCKHGTYVGYPGGPDYICGACEMGYGVIYRGLKALLRYRIWYPEKGLWGIWNEIATSYSLGGILGWKTWFDLFAESTFEYELEIVLDTYQFWGPEE